MQPHRSITEPLRAQRLLRWAALWLVWLASVIYETLDLDPRRPPAWTRRYLHFAVRIVGLILVVNAATHLRAPPRTRHRHGSLKHRAHKRALIGGVLRHALRARDVRAMLAALYAAITNPAPHIARLTRRLRHGLTRLRTIAPMRSVAPCIAQLVTPPVCADSS